MEGEDVVDESQEGDVSEQGSNGAALFIWVTFSRWSFEPPFKHVLPLMSVSFGGR